MTAHRKKILMVIDHLDAGGAQTLLVDLVTGLDKERFDVLVCSLRKSSQFVAALEKAGARVVVLQQKKYNPLKFFRLLRLIRQEKVDIIHTHLTAARIFGVAAGVAGRVAKIYSHDHSGDEYLRKSPVIAKWILFPLDRFLARWTEKVFAVSQNTCEFNLQIKRIDPQKVIWAPNWIDYARFSGHGRSRQETRRKWCLSESQVVVGTVGRLDEQKGHCYLIDAFPGILEKHPDVVLVFVGDGPLRARLEHQACQRGVFDACHFVGFVEDIETAYPAFDLFVLSSIYEPFGLVLLEAMASCVPVVASDVDGVPEFVDHGKNGFLVPAKDPVAITEAVCRLIEEKETVTSFVASAREMVLRRYDRQIGLARILEHYR